MLKVLFNRRLKTNFARVINYKHQLGDAINKHYTVSRYVVFEKKNPSLLFSGSG